MKTVTIFNRTFELVQSKKYPITVDTVNIYMSNFTGKDLFNYYDNPSTIKRLIYDEWKEWAFNSRFNNEVSNDSVEYMQVASANCMTFTIDALVFDKYGFIKYMLHITKSHNYAYPVVINC